MRCASLLASPATEPALRAQADGWLAAFRLDPAAWGVALGVLRSGPGAAPPEVRLQAAALLAWKCKRQLAQLQPAERQAELAEALTALAADGQQQQQQPDVATRGVCTALANLAIHCAAWARPLDTLGEAVGQLIPSLAFSQSQARPRACPPALRAGPMPACLPTPPAPLQAPAWAATACWSS